MPRAHEILLVDDNPADAALVQEALARSPLQSRLRCFTDGEQAVAYLRDRAKSAGHPELMILDLNLPKKDERAVLADVKADAELRQIPVVVFSTSQSARDIASSYELGANCYVCKPGNLQGFFQAVRSIEEFWFGCASLPYGGQ